MGDFSPLKEVKPVVAGLTAGLFDVLIKVSISVDSIGQDKRWLNWTLRKSRQQRMSHHLHCWSGTFGLYPVGMVYNCRTETKYSVDG